MLFLTAAALLLGVWQPYRKAQQIRAKLQSMDWADSSNEEVRNFAREFGGTFACEKEWCEAEIHVSNRVLSALRLAPPIDFRTLIHTQSNRVANVSLTLTNVGRGASSILIAETFEPNGLALQGRDYVVDRGRGRNAPFVAVRISATTARNQGMMMINNLNIACLRRLSGCTMQQLGPGIWNLGG